MYCPLFVLVVGLGSVVCFPPFHVRFLSRLDSNEYSDWSEEESQVSDSSGSDYSEPYLSGSDYSESYQSGSDYSEPYKSRKDYSESCQSGSDYSEPYLSGSDYSDPCTSGSDYSESEQSESDYSESESSGSDYSESESSGRHYSKYYSLPKKEECAVIYPGRGMENDLFHGRCRREVLPALCRDNAMSQYDSNSWDSEDTYDSYGSSETEEQDSSEDRGYFLHAFHECHRLLPRYGKLDLQRHGDCLDILYPNLCNKFL
ncbi:hypothetical protein J6590_027155 [Homalodisca vitripennis]|nr:hypothetical protein J6590_027155 [Homalodisca vitripennis]